MYYEGSDVTDHGDTKSFTNVTFIKHTQYEYYQSWFHYKSHVHYVIFSVIYILNVENDHKYCYKQIVDKVYTMFYIVKCDLVNSV